MTETGFTPGQVVSVRLDGARLVYDRTDERGQPRGHIESPDGTSSPERPLLSILVRGYWEAPPAE